ncbi:MAG: ABC transporter ATP-binding protein [Betaproteobacteria bacterium]|nr:ABC transporter ATP-binding protein [Betaproteobacteria bacterium]NBT74772.1 ABC transporter ATP-binding protein [Betaproteobacteria bacterium]NBY14103.1 ABC transporter ATP-binding protein [Betaproteobacteria bacterium]NCA16991.1 ABC transporter ATP-binding protein [Betaproteobacteria bacterium]
MTRPLLEVSDVSKRFGGVAALSGVSLQIPRGEIVGLIGPNGAGKTTLFNVITGLYPPDSGNFSLDGRRYDPESIHRVVEAGIARTFQNIRLFAQMTALQNVMVGRHIRSSGPHSGPLGAIFRTPTFRRNERAIAEAAQSLLHYVGIGALSQSLASTLSYGDQRRLEIARALATDPLLLALDEPAAGMNPTEKNTLEQLLRRIQADGRTILLIEHDVRMVMGLCSDVTVLDAGRVISRGAPRFVREDPAVIEAYLGRGHRHG